MKDLLYICIKNPMTSRDVQRMGLYELRRKFDVHILDCTPWLMPKAYTTRIRERVVIENLHRINSLADLKNELGPRRGGYAVDYIGLFSIKAVILFYYLKSNGFKIIVIDSGSYPYPTFTTKKDKSWRKILRILRTKNLSTSINSIMIRLLLKFMPDQRPDYALVAGNSWRENRRFQSANLKIPSHSFDYELFRSTQESLSPVRGAYAVYLDEKIVGHEDNFELGLRDPATKEFFYPALKRFFDIFESKTGLQVVIAAYPSSDGSDDRNFDGREVIREQTALLVKASKIVFSHASTSISFAVLSRRPIVFLTSNEIISSWYQPWIEAPARTLCANMINIDNLFEFNNIDLWWGVNEHCYGGFVESYIKSKDDPGGTLWDKFNLLRID